MIKRSLRSYIADSSALTVRITTNDGYTSSTCYLFILLVLGVFETIDANMTPMDARGRQGTPVGRQLTPEDANRTPGDFREKKSTLKMGRK